MTKIFKNKKSFFCLLLISILILGIVFFCFFPHTTNAYEVPPPTSIPSIQYLQGSFILYNDSYTDTDNTASFGFNYKVAEAQGTTFETKFANAYGNKHDNERIRNCDMARMFNVYLTYDTSKPKTGIFNPSGTILSQKPHLIVDKEAYVAIDNASLRSVINNIQINGVNVVNNTISGNQAKKEAEPNVYNGIPSNQFKDGDNILKIRYRLETELSSTIPNMTYAVYVEYTTTIKINATTPPTPSIVETEQLKAIYSNGYLCNYKDLSIDLKKQDCFFTKNSSSSATYVGCIGSVLIKNYITTEDTYNFYFYNTANLISSALTLKIDKTSPFASLKQSNNYLTISYADAQSGIASATLSSNGITIDVTNNQQIAIVPNSYFSLTVTDKSGNVANTTFTSYFVDGLPSFGNFNILDTITYADIDNYNCSINGTTITKNQNCALIPNTDYTFSIADKFFNNSYSFVKTSSNVIWKEFDKNNAQGAVINNNSISSSGFKNSNFTASQLFVNTIPTTSTIWTVSGGKYKCKLVDFLGNFCETDFVAQYDTFPKNTIIGMFYEQPTTINSFYSFANYDNAIKYGYNRELDSVITMNDYTDPNAGFPGGCPIEPTEKLEFGKPYYKYKSISDEKLGIVAYFNLENVKKACTFYSKKSISSYYYFDKEPAKAYAGENLFLEYNMYNESVRFAPYGDLVFKVSHDESQKETLFDASMNSSKLIYSNSGSSKLKIVDRYGNVFNFDIIILASAPDTFYSFSKGGQLNLLASASNYRKPIYISIESKDYISFLIVRDINTNNRMFFKQSDTDQNIYLIANSGSAVIPQFGTNGLKNYLYISTSGEYKITSINHCQTKNNYNLNFSDKLATVDFYKNEKTRQYEISITKSLDSFVTISQVYIYASNDNLSWLQKSEDESASHITIDLNNFLGKTAVWNFFIYKFYKVVVYDNFGESASYSASEDPNGYIRPAPSGLFMVNNAPISTTQFLDGTYYSNKQDIKFVFGNTVDYMVNTTFTHFFSSPNSEIIEQIIAFNFDDIYLKLEGKHTFRITDETTHLFNEYIIIIDKTAPTLASVPSKFINYNIVIDYTIEKNTSPISAEYEKDSLLTILSKENCVISAEGYYHLKIKDFSGNETSYYFNLDKTAPTGSLTNCALNGYSNLANGTIRISEIIDNCSQEQNIKIVLTYIDIYGNISKESLSLANASFKKDGKYIVQLTDEANNTSSLENAIVFIVDTQAPLYSSNIKALNKTTTNKDVYISWHDANEFESPIICLSYFNSVEKYYLKDTIMTESGSYSIKITDMAGNITTITFDIDKIPVVGYFFDRNGKAIPNNSIINKAFIFNWKDPDTTCLMNNNSYIKNIVNEAENVYQFILTDKAGNESKYKIQISFKIPIIEFYDKKTIIENGSTNTNNITVKMLENYSLELYYKNNLNNWIKTDVKADNNSFEITENGAYKVAVTNSFFTYDYLINLSKDYEVKLFIQDKLVEKTTKAVSNQSIKLNLPNSDRYFVSIKNDTTSVTKNFIDDILLFDTEGNFVVQIYDTFKTFLKEFVISINKTSPVIISIFCNNTLVEENNAKLKNANLKFVFDKNIARLVIIDKDKKIVKSFENASTNKKEFLINSNDYKLYGEFTYAFIDEAGNNIGYTFTNKNIRAYTVVDYILIGLSSALVLAVIVVISVYFSKNNIKGRKHIKSVKQKV